MYLPHSSAPQAPAPRALVVNHSEEDRCAIRSILIRFQWNLDAVALLQEAISWMERCGPPSIIICERTLPDGDWQVLLRENDKLPCPPRLVVSSRHADEYLWGEVLNLGGYDVLATPFDPQEVTHVVSTAWRSWHQQWAGALPAASARMESNSRASAASSGVTGAG